MAKKLYVVDNQHYFTFDKKTGELGQVKYEKKINPASLTPDVLEKLMILIANDNDP